MLLLFFSFADSFASDQEESPPSNQKPASTAKN
ncbi:hypothetical protein GGQ60_001319 [Pedobacter zeae]|uniref:Uncharacterized protein n=1 Tax=Pedobacter zeae TaxID=1737356 RepID=A0A7W6P4B2_9SPHI|nr:hypothetical protein [Pedobacter zeae]